VKKKKYKGEKSPATEPEVNPPINHRGTKGGRGNTGPDQQVLRGKGHKGGHRGAWGGGRVCGLSWSSSQ